MHKQQPFLPMHACLSSSYESFIRPYVLGTDHRLTVPLLCCTAGPGMNSSRQHTGLTWVLCCVLLHSAVAKHTYRALHGEHKPVTVVDGRQRSTEGRTYLVVRKRSVPSPCRDIFGQRRFSPIHAYRRGQVPPKQVKGSIMEILVAPCRAIWGRHCECAAQPAEGPGGSKAA